MTEQIKLGNKVECCITGFTGIATAKVEYLNGRVRWQVEPKVGADGKMIDAPFLDQEQLVVVRK